MTLTDSRPTGTQTIAVVETHSDPQRVEAAWAQLEAASGSPYQARRWLLPWYEACARPAGVEPLVVLARGAEGAPLALLPLAVRKRAGVRVAAWAGGRHSNSNLPLVCPSAAIDAAAMGECLAQVGAQARLDAFELLNQPETWDGQENPCARLAARPSPSALHSTRLEASVEAFRAARLSPKANKRIRWRMRKLEEFGPVAVRRLETADEIEQGVAAFIEQKRQRLRERGMGRFDFEEAEAFFRALAAQPDPGIEFFALFVGERICAIYAGTRHRNRFSCMINSISLDPEIMRTSPGDLLIKEVLERLIAQGLTGFDLGIGDAAYKDAWCEDVDLLVDSLVPVTTRGRAYCALTAVSLSAKRAIKANEKLAALARRALSVFSR